MLEWLSVQPPLLIYLFLFINGILESGFPPYPSDIIVVVIAFSAGQGNFDPYAVYLTATIGSITGIMIVYAIARCKGNAVIEILAHSRVKKLIPLKMIERAKKKFARHDDIIIILNRFLPGMRAAINVAAGISHVKPRKMFVYSSVSVLFWNLFLVVIGFSVGSSWHEAASFLRNYNIVVTLVLIILLVVFSFVYFRKRRGAG